MNIYFHAHYPPFNYETIKEPPGIGFNLTDDGNYDMENKILKYCNNPIDDEDVTTKKFVLDEIKEKCLYSHDGHVFDAGDRRIGNVKDPVEDMNVVNKKFFEKGRKN